MLETFGLCLLFGGFAGILAGMFGIGGGMVLVPFFVWLFNRQGVAAELNMIMAVATSLATIIVTAAAAIAAHHRRGAVLWDIVAYLAPTVFAGAVLGSLIAEYLPAVMLKTIFACFLIYAALQMAFHFQPGTRDLQRNPLLLRTAGMAIGMISAILGIGGGTLTVPFLTRCRFPIRNAVAIASTCGLPIAIAGTLGYILLGWNKTGLPVGSAGFVYLPAFFGIVITSSLLAPVGAMLAQSLPTLALKRYFSVLLLVAAIKLLW